MLSGGYEAAEHSGLFRRRDCCIIRIMHHTNHEKQP